MIEKIKDKFCKLLKKRNIDSLKLEYIKICLIYLIIGVTWVYASDSVVMILFKNKQVIRMANTYKGFIYITLTTIILYLLIDRLIKKVQVAEKQLSDSNNELLAANVELQTYIEQLKETEEELRAQYDQIIEYDKNLSISEEKYKTLMNQMQLGLALYEGNVNDDIKEYRLIEVNNSHEKLTGLKKDRVLGKYFYEVHPDFEPEYLDKLNKTVSTGEPCLYERYKKSMNTYYEILAYRPKENQLAVMVNDVTERKRMEEKLQYISYHDQLTGLYNRHFFAQEMERFNCKEYLPLTITLADINGLKLINDSFGHIMGDEYIKKIAETLQSAYREKDVVCRLSGDEFLILSPNTDAKEAEGLVNNFYKLAKNEKVNAMDLSISIGYSTRYSQEEDELVVYKKAEDYMYKKKLLESPSMRGRTVNTIITTLHEKNPREELHSRRVSELCEKMGVVLGFQEDKIRELKTVGLLHDIGKVAIEEGILNKPGKLTEEEFEEIKKHPEIGYRILSTVSDLSDLADYVLAHHERWDGKGYPKGLKEQEIPIESRIISIADTYDAIVSERSYRSALSKDFAISELKKNAGTQFCPELVTIFIDKVL